MTTTQDNHPKPTFADKHRNKHFSNLPALWSIALQANFPDKKSCKSLSDAEFYASYAAYEIFYKVLFREEWHPGKQYLGTTLDGAQELLNQWMGEMLVNLEESK